MDSSERGSPRRRPAILYRGSSPLFGAAASRPVAVRDRPILESRSGASKAVPFYGESAPDPALVGTGADTTSQKGAIRLPVPKARLTTGLWARP